MRVGKQTESISHSLMMTVTIGVLRYGVLALVLIAIICQYLSIRALQIEEANVISLVENSGSIIVSLVLQIVIFQVSLGQIRTD